MYFIKTGMTLTLEHYLLSSSISVKAVTDFPRINFNACHPREGSAQEEDTHTRTPRYTIPPHHTYTDYSNPRVAIYVRYRSMDVYSQ